MIPAPFTFWIKLGLSVMPKVLDDVLRASAHQVPVRPGETRTSVAPPTGFQPVVLLSKLAFVTKLPGTVLTAMTDVVTAIAVVSRAESAFEAVKITG